MISRRFNLYLGFGVACLLAQFATLGLCFASEPAKTAEQTITAKPSDPVAVVPPKGKLPHALISLTSETGNFSPYALLVDKASRTLTVWQSEGDGLKNIGAWPADIGRRSGDKIAEGDHKTPEGIYFFETMMDGKAINFEEYGVRIFTMDYPNYFDKLDKKTGSGIWLHAIPDTKSLLRGSRGCVVVRNHVIEELGKYIELRRTPIVVVDQVDYMDIDKWKALRAQLKDWVETWRKAWGGKDIETYMAFYGDRFSGNGLNKNQWRRYKERLAKRYEFIKIDLKDIQVFNQGPKIVFRFMQNYESDKTKDVGAKIIYVTKSPEQKFEIIGEKWQALEAPRLRPAAMSTPPVVKTEKSADHSAN